MTERQYMMGIKRKCEALGVWKKEFEQVQRRLARIYARIDRLEAEWEAEGGRLVVEHTNKAGATNAMKNPYVAEIDFLYDQALFYEKEMGLTPAALKKIKEGAMRAKGESPMNGMMRVLKMA